MKWYYLIAWRNTLKLSKSETGIWRRLQSYSKDRERSVARDQKLNNNLMLRYSSQPNSSLVNTFYQTWVTSEESLTHHICYFDMLSLFSVRNKIADENLLHWTSFFPSATLFSLLNFSSPKKSSNDNRSK